MKKYTSRERNGYTLVTVKTSCRLDRKHFENLTSQQDYINSIEPNFRIELDYDHYVREPGTHVKSKQNINEIYECKYTEFFGWFSENDISCRCTVSRNGLVFNLSDREEFDLMFRMFGLVYFYQSSNDSPVSSTDDINILDNILKDKGSLYVSGPLSLAHIILEDGVYSAYGCQAEDISTLLRMLCKLGRQEIRKGIVYASGTKPSVTLEIVKQRRRIAVKYTEPDIEYTTDIEPSMFFAFNQVTLDTSGNSAFDPDKVPQPHVIIDR